MHCNATTCVAMMHCFGSLLLSFSLFLRFPILGKTAIPICLSIPCKIRCRQIVGKFPFSCDCHLSHCCTNMLRTADSRQSPPGEVTFQQISESMVLEGFFVPPSREGRNMPHNLRPVVGMPSPGGENCRNPLHC